MPNKNCTSFVFVCARSFDDMTQFGLRSAFSDNAEHTFGAYTRSIIFYHLRISFSYSSRFLFLILFNECSGKEIPFAQKANCAFKIIIQWKMFLFNDASVVIPALFLRDSFGSFFIICPYCLKQTISLRYRAYRMIK